MTRAEIEIRLSEIASLAGDDEVAHGLEDMLQQDFLRALARGDVPTEEIAPLSALVLTSLAIDFSRWKA